MLLLQALLLFLLLLHLFPLLFLCLLRSLLLAGLDLGLVLLRIGLLFLEAPRTLGAFLRVLSRILPRLVELALEVGLLAIVRRLIRRTLRRFGPTPRLVERVLTLLVLVGLRAARFGGRTLRRLLRVACALQGFLLVALLRASGATLVVQGELLGMNLPSDRAHFVTRTAQAGIHEKLAIAVVNGDAVHVVVLGRAGVERLLARVEIARVGGGDAARGRTGHGLCKCHGGHAERPCECRRGQNGTAQRDDKTGGWQRRRRGSEHGRNSNTRARPPEHLWQNAPLQQPGLGPAFPLARGAPREALQPIASSMTDTVALKIVQRIATELTVQPRQVAAAVQLLDEGATVPFIARYRKEVTGNLDDTQLRQLEERLLYLREMEDRRATILASIEEQGKLTDELRAAIDAADSKQVLEDLYLPYKPKRRTRAQIAREAGLEPLAQALLADPRLDPQTEAAAYVDAEKGVADVKAALDGARDILSEQFGETAELLGKLRDYLSDRGVVSSSVVDGKENEEGEKFRDYYDYAETLKTVPSHRALALFRGRNAGVLMIKLGLGEELDAQVPHPCEAMIARHAGISNQNRPADKWLSDVCRWCWRVKVQPHLENELLTQLRETAEHEAIRVFARNLKDLLLAAPAGPKAVIGLDPGLRTGVKVAVVDRTGKLLATDTIYPHEPRRDWDGSIAKLARIAAQTQAELVSIGNGTASRETDKLASELMTRHPELNLQKIVVSEAGASVYSASELAAKEFPELDVSLRGAVSIARRLQDPLAELVKIEPKAIGVGQYQHDVNQRELARALDAVVEDCVNAVGVDANTASVALLARVSGLNGTLARNIVEFRDANGPFPSREHLRKVPRLGDKTFEQAAGFLRINGGDNPLDRSSVHPEAYPVVERMLAKIRKQIGDVLGNREALSGLSPTEFVDERFGLPTVRDILSELEKPGRDPRPEFKTATFREGVEKISDLAPGMVLEGVVTNVAAFGAFVDIGVHQDGLVHVSAMSTKFIKDPHEVVKAGQVVKVKVLDVDVKRQRIALTMRLADDAAPAPRGGVRDERGAARPGNAARGQQRGRDSEPAGAMAAAFAKLKQR